MNLQGINAWLMWVVKKVQGMTEKGFDFSESRFCHLWKVVGVESVLPPKQTTLSLVETPKPITSLIR